MLNYDIDIRDIKTAADFERAANLPLPPDAAEWTWTQAANHSLAKWELIRTLNDTSSKLDLMFYVWDGSCALCQKAKSISKPADDYCQECPLYQVGYGCLDYSRNSKYTWAEAREELRSDEDEDRKPGAVRRMVQALRLAAARAMILDKEALAGADIETNKEGAALAGATLTKEGAD